MSKLLMFKDWLTIEEASYYLTEVLSETVKPTDIYRLALESKLVLSLCFVNNTYIEIASTDSNNDLLFTNQYQLIPANTYCDLIAIDNSTLILKQHYYDNLPIPLRPDHDTNKGIILCLPDGLTYGRLINYIEDNRQLSQITIAPCLCSDTYLIARTDYLNNFIDQVTQPEARQELHPKEKASLYQLIAILATVAKLPINQNYKTADLITEQIAPQLGITPPSRETLAKHLKEAYNVLP